MKIPWVWRSQLEAEQAAHEATRKAYEDLMELSLKLANATVPAEIQPEPDRTPIKPTIRSVKAWAEERARKLS